MRAQLGDYTRAIRDLEQLVSKKTNNKAAYGVLSSLLAEKHDYEKAITILEEAYPRFPDDEWIINNLAYVHLMLGHAQAARVLLEGRPLLRKAEHVALTATWGLLYLREGDLEKAREWYKSAANLAFQFGKKKVAVVVRQKMHLEFAPRGAQERRCHHGAS